MSSPPIENFLATVLPGKRQVGSLAPPKHDAAGLTAVRIIYQLKISTPEKINISNIKHKILACFHTICVNLKLFKQELPKLLDCKMMSNFLKHLVYRCSGGSW